MVVHRLDATPESIHVGFFDPALPSVLTIASGDEVVLETRSHWDDLVGPDTTLDDILRFREEVFPDVGPHSLTGPIEVAGAKPGQVLRVDVLRLVPREHGYTFFLPGAVGTGLLPEDFPMGGIRHLVLDRESMTTWFAPGVRLPLAPFLGVMGVAPPTPGQHSSVSPGAHGGNLDLPELSAGASLYLPVWQEGALFSAGDAHARQGHGEVCLTAIETAMEEAHLRFTVLEGPPLQTPRVETPEAWITLGIDEDLLEACRLAVRSMIDLLEADYGLDRGDAYCLCSVAVDLTVTQVANPKRGVHARLAKAFFAA